MEALWAFVPLIVLLIIFLITKLCKQSWKNDLQEKIAWLSQNDLFFSITNTQNDLCPPDFCKLTTEDEECIRSVMKVFSQKRQSDFIQDKLVYNRGTCKMTNVCYFMHSLCSFLSDWDWNRKFQHHDLCTVIEHKTLESAATWGGRKWVETCKLTDWGRTFCKLHFISLRYCEFYSSSPLRDSEKIKESLTTGIIIFYKW